MKKLSEKQKAMLKHLREQKKLEKNKQAELLRVESLRNRELEDLRKKPLPNPRFLFKIGDRLKPRTANYGNMNVLDVLDNGKILKVDFDKPEKGYMYISHLDALPLNFEEKSSFSVSNKKTIFFNTTMVEGLFSMHYTFGVDYSPIYQREFCWTISDKEKLIDSIFKNIEIGKFAFIENPDSINFPFYEILDGKQRLSALVEFYEDGFSYNGKTFSELSRKDKYHFINYPVTYGIGTQDFSLEEKMEYFLKMNVMGVPQSKEHLNSIYEKLKSLSKK